MRAFSTVLFFCGILIFTSAFGTPIALGDWNVNDPAKWVQLPDLSENGLNIYAPTLANDWLCTSVDKVTDFHVWGSWLNDNPVKDAVFTLSIYNDEPALSDSDYSNPIGDPLWTMKLTNDATNSSYYVPKLVTESTAFQFYNVTTNTYSTDKQLWLYNFYIDPEKAFIQKGEAQSPIVYWLSLSVSDPAGAQTYFGWHTTAPADKKLDDSVFLTGSPTLGWLELIYPAQSAYYPRSLDLAFTVTPEPTTWALIVCSFVGASFYFRRKR